MVEYDGQYGSINRGTWRRMGRASTDRAGESRKLGRAGCQTKGKDSRLVICMCLYVRVVKVYLDLMQMTNELLTLDSFTKTGFRITPKLLYHSRLIIMTLFLCYIFDIPHMCLSRLAGKTTYQMPNLFT